MKKVETTMKTTTEKRTDRFEKEPNHNSESKIIVTEINSVDQLNI